MNYKEIALEYMKDIIHKLHNGIINRGISIPFRISSLIITNNNLNNTNNTMDNNNNENINENNPTDNTESRNENGVESRVGYRLIPLHLPSYALTHTHTLINTELYHLRNNITLIIIIIMQTII